MSPSDRRVDRIALAVAMRVTPMVIGRCHPAQGRFVWKVCRGGVWVHGAWRAGLVGPEVRDPSGGAGFCNYCTPGRGAKETRPGPGRAGSVLGTSVPARAGAAGRRERGSGRASCPVG